MTMTTMGNSPIQHTIETAPVDELDQARRELAAFRAVAERLWPAVRFFGLCGAAPEYIEAVAELGTLLGKVQHAAPAVDASAAAAQARREGAQQALAAVTDWAKSDEAREIGGRQVQARMAEAISRLRIE